MPRGKIICEGEDGARKQMLSARAGVKREGGCAREAAEARRGGKE